MKQRLVHGVRSTLPEGGIRMVEEIYRRSRVMAISAKYGFPARSLKVVAVTGTNGKTTTASYLNEILKAAGLRTAMFTTAVIEVDGERRINDLNATVASTDEMQRFFAEARRTKADYVVLEITSHALQQHKLDGVPIECAIMTNLTQDHLDYHHSMEEYAHAKGKLFDRRPRFSVLNRDDSWYDYFSEFEARDHTMTYGTHEFADARITHVKLYRKGSEMKLAIDHQTNLEFATALPGKYNAYNATAAATAAYLLHIKLGAIVEGVANLESIPGRFERVETDKGYEVVVDYAHTPDALEQLLSTAKELGKNRTILVFGACGDRDKAKRPIMGEIAAKHADRIIVTDEESYNEDPETIRSMIMDGIKSAKGTGKTEEIADRRDAIKKALSIARKGDTILVTGMGHEQYRIVDGERLPWNDTQVVKELLATK